MQLLTWTTELVYAFFKDAKQIKLRNLRTALALKTSIATTLAVLISWLFHIQDPYWAGISAMMVLIASSGATIERAILRVIATIVAVLWALLLVVWFGKSPFLLILCAFFTMVFSFYYARKTDKLYAWLLGPGTFLLVMFSIPLESLSFAAISHVAYYRTLEVIIGTGCQVGLLSYKYVWQYYCLSYFIGDS
ncbi:MAG: FUSC family protein [Gammaproteobacteria bacterium]|nr:FUSC family protein [Gammaproteobacteria bacterium]